MADDPLDPLRDGQRTRGDVVIELADIRIARGMLRSYAARTRTLALNAYRRWWQAMQGGTVVNFGKKFPVSQKEGS